MRFAILVALAVLASCKPTPAPHPVVTDSAFFSCDSVVKNLIALGCKDARGASYSDLSPAGETFVQTCYRTQDAGAHIPIDCLSTAVTCEEAKACR
jgi:hypothetical protein